MLLNDPVPEEIDEDDASDLEEEQKQLDSLGNIQRKGISTKDLNSSISSNEKLRTEYGINAMDLDIVGLEEYLVIEIVDERDESESVKSS